MSGDAPVGSPPRAAPWTAPRGDVILTPIRGGALPGFLAAAALAAGLSWSEGGVDEVASRSRGLVQAAMVVAAIPVIGLYARRIVLCTTEGDRPVPWGSDSLDRTTWFTDAAAFAAVLVASLAPAVVLTLVVQAAGAANWVLGVAGAAGLVLGAAHLPFAVASTVLRDGPIGALWGGSVRAWRANGAVARTVVVPALVLLGLFGASLALARFAVPPLQSGRPEHEHTAARDLGRAAVFALRLGSVWASFCVFRMAGLVVRDVPEIREVLE